MLKKINKKGFSLVEMLIYVSLLSIISVVIINMLFSLTGTYKTVVALRAAEHSGIDSMERITRDVRSATSVDIGNSLLGVSPGELTLVATANGVSTTTRFYVDNGVLKVDVNGQYLGPITLSNAYVTDLVFRFLDNGFSSAIKVDLTIEGRIGTVIKSKKYHSTTVLRGN